MMISQLRKDADGSIRVSGTRVTLESVIDCHHRSDTPEDIHESFDVLPIADIKAVITYYSANRVDIDRYIAMQDEIGDEWQRHWEER